MEIAEPLRHSGPRGPPAGLPVASGLSGCAELALPSEESVLSSLCPSRRWSVSRPQRQRSDRSPSEQRPSFTSRRAASGCWVAGRLTLSSAHLCTCSVFSPFFLIVVKYTYQNWPSEAIVK